MELLQWWNLPFMLSLALGVLYLVPMALGGHHDGGDADTDADLHDVGIAHHDIDHDADHDISHDADHDVGAIAKAFSIVGVGKVPLSMILISLFFLWGFIGVASNTLFAEMMRPEVFFWPSFALASVGSVFFTRLIARGLARIMPTFESYAVSPRQLIGKTADVRYAITDCSGTATLYDEYKNFREVSCRVRDGEEPIAQGKVVLMEYDQADHVYVVRPDPAALLDATDHIRQLP